MHSEIREAAPFKGIKPLPQLIPHTAAVLGSVLPFVLTVSEVKVGLLNFLINFRWSELESTWQGDLRTERTRVSSGSRPSWLWCVSTLLTIKHVLVAFTSCLSSVLVRKRSSGSFSFPRSRSLWLEERLCCYSQVHRDQCPCVWCCCPGRFPARPAPLLLAGSPGAGYEARPCPCHQRSPSPCPACLFWCGRRKAPILWPESEENVQNCSSSVSLCSLGLRGKPVGAEQALEKPSGWHIHVIPNLLSLLYVTGPMSSTPRWKGS